MAENRDTILIVDDEPVSLEFFRGLAEENGFCVQTCPDAESAWEYFEQERPRLIVLDWNLPTLSGLELCKQIKADPIGKYVAVLMVSVRDQADDLEEALQAGSNYFMSKPVQPKFFQAWLSVAQKNTKTLLEHEESDRKLQEYKLEMEDMNNQLEYSINQANKLTMEAERSYLEINQIFKTVAGGIILIDKDCNIIRHNETFLEMAGIAEGEEANGKCHELFHSTLCNTPDCPLNKIEQGAERIESRIVKESSDGTRLYYDIVSTPFRGVVGEIQGIVEHITDVTQRVEAEEALKESEERYRKLSTVDELTGLFNKRHFNKTILAEIDRAKRYGPPLSLLMMDIDNFKIHNDTYGHAEGDKVLARLGEIITGALRNTDYPSRYGGEEFAVVMPNTNGEGAAVVAERIRMTLAKEDFFPIPGEKVNKTLSLGVTEFLPDDDRESLIKRADANLYQAKESGKNRYVMG